MKIPSKNEIISILESRQRNSTNISRNQVSPTDATINAERVPKAKTSKFKLPSLKTLTIDPTGNLYFYWLSIFSLIFLYNVVVLIMRAAFEKLGNDDNSIIWYLIDYGFCDLIYIFDIVVKLRTSKYLNLSIFIKIFAYLYLKKNLFSKLSLKTAMSVQMLKRLA